MVETAAAYRKCLSPLLSCPWGDMLELSGSVAGCLPGRNRMVQGLRHFTMPGSHRLGLLGGQGVKHLIAPRAIRSDF